MAECTNSTPTPIASRRRSGAGLLTVIAGSVITSGVAAGTAASVGDVAELISVCAAFCASDVAVDRIREAEPDLSDEDRDALIVPICAGEDIMLDRMTGLTRLPTKALPLEPRH